MSPNVGNFVHDLVEMAKAMETLPQVQDELARANTALDNYAQMVQARELAIVNYKDQIEQLNAKVRSLEVERDDASFRVLEAEDQNHSLLSVARVAQANLSVILATLNPPKPEPVKEPESVASTPSEPQAPTTPAEDTTRPLELSSTVSGDGSILGESSKPISDTVHSISEVGQSESSPTSASVDMNPKTAHIHLEETASSATEPTHGPYFGKRYWYNVGYVSHSDWIAGGGTEEDYNWQPASTRDF